MKFHYNEYDPIHTTEQMMYPYRRKNIKHPSAARISKYEQRPLKKFHVITCYLTLPVVPSVMRQFWALMGNILTKFFFPQYFQKIKVMHRRVTSVDHELDSKIPFKPLHLDTYLDFIKSHLPLLLSILQVPLYRLLPIQKIILYITV